MKPVIDVCIATYKRPEGLARLLASLATQETMGEFTFVIHVADNDAARSAESLVDSFRAGGLDVTYDVEPRQNISLARNKSLEPARGDFVAITDDDLYAEPDWLLRHLQTSRRFGADVLHGPVLPHFLPGTPAHIRTCRVFVRPDMESGSTEGYVFTAANSFFRRSLIDGIDAPFDATLGRTGGEDTRFFNALRDRGCRMMWCHEAVIQSDVPAERARLRWIARRRFRSGTLTRLKPGQPTRPAGSPSAKAKLVEHTSLAAFHLLRGLFSRPSHEEGMRHVVEIVMIAAYVAGRIAGSTGYRYEEYRAR